MTFPPQAFIIGAQKSATTSLAFLLNQHPMVVLSEPKEPDYLTVNWGKGIDWYRSCFRSIEGILIDASVGYTMGPVEPSRAGEIVAPGRAFQISPQAKFIYMVRDPANRCYSAYWHDVRAGRETRPLREAVESGAYYVWASFYFQQLKAYLQYFPLDRFLIVNFADFSKDPQAVANRCLQFLGASPTEFKFTIGERKNESFNYTGFGRWLQGMLGNERLKTISAITASLIPSPLRRHVKRILSTDVPQISNEDYVWLRARFRDDASSFERLTGVQVL